MSTRFSKVVIFGGGGYIGSYFAAHLLDMDLADTVYLVDISREKEQIWPQTVKEGVKQGAIKYVECDVRLTIDSLELPEQCDLICNFAAIHREPGHSSYEYYETNLNGALNVCEWAEYVCCDNIIFTSSIAPYGPGEEKKTEQSLPTPKTPYGSSKLVAEKIHMAWQNRDINARYLSIVRPGVVYGPGEDGNVPRMIRAVIGRYFFYVGNQETRKAGGYIKELTNAMNWVMQKQLGHNEYVVLYNFAMPVPPSIKEYVEAICYTAKIKRKVMSLPFSFLLVVSHILDFIARPLRVNHPFSPVRIKKLKRSNCIIPEYLVEHGYEFRYGLKESFCDWISDKPTDWSGI